MQLKKIADQVVVVTGASSGIGLATARLAAERGACVVLAARSEEPLLEVVEGIQRAGGHATYLVADVADEAEVQRIAERALESFGRIDTWVNNAAVSVYGRIEEVSVGDMRRLMDVAFWGSVYGCRAALPHLRAAGGALINVGSVESELSLPYNGIYAAAKHALKAFTDVLRLELEKEGAPVSVSLVKPASIDTPFFEHAKNYLEGDPAPAPPVYAPEVVARAILECAERPVRDVVVGGSGKVMIAASQRMPRLTDRLLRATMFRAQEREPRPGRDREGALHAPRGSYGRARGDHPGRVLESSAYTYLSLHPGWTAALALGAVGLGLSLWLRP